MMKKILNLALRFPLCVLYVFVIAWISIYINHFLSESLNQDILEILIKIIITFINLFFLSLSFYILSETENFSKIKTQIYQAIAMIFAALFYYHLIDIQQAYFIIISFWLFALIFVAWFLFKAFSKKYEKKEYYNYFITLTEIISYSLAAWVLSLLLWLIAINSFFYLFDLYSTFSVSNLNMDRTAISLAVIAPLFGLSKIPEKFNEIERKENKLLLFIVKYIYVWFFYLFFIILYIYSLQVLTHLQERPNWIIPFLVVCFSSFAYLVYFQSEIYEESEKSIKFFRKVLPFVVIPQIFMLFYAIWLRIMQYDLTTNRYLILIFGIWIFLLSIYFIVSKNKRIIVIPLSLSFVCLTFTLWPWSFQNLPKIRQLNNLKENLQKAGILENGKTHITDKWIDIDEKLGNKIYGQISYLCYIKNCEEIAKLFPKEYEDFVKDEKRWNLRYFNFKDFLADKLNIKKYNWKDIAINDQKLVDISFGNAHTEPVNIAWYDLMYSFSIDQFKDKDKDKNTITLQNKEILDIGFDIKEKIIENKDKDQLEFEFLKDDKKYKIIVEMAYITQYKNWKNYYSISWKLLIWKK